MALICVLCGGLQVFILLTITGVLVSLAALSRLMELMFIIIQPSVLFILRRSLKLILFFTVLSLQRVLIVLRATCTNPQPVGNDPTSRINGIGTEPVTVAYGPSNYEFELTRKRRLWEDDEFMNGTDENNCYGLKRPSLHLKTGRPPVQIPSDQFNVDFAVVECSESKIDVEEQPTETQVESSSLSHSQKSQD